MKVIFVLLQFSLINYAITFILRKPTESYPVPSNYAATRVHFLVNDHYKNVVEIPSFGYLIKSLRIPGFNVYRIVFNQEVAGNHDKFSELTPKLNSQAITKNSNHTDEYSFNFASDKKNNSDNFKPKKAPDSENILDKTLIEINCGSQNTTDTEKCNKETTTDINEVTTDVDLLNENSTVTSDYDENYGGLSDRSEVSPSLLASLVG